MRARIVRTRVHVGPGSVVTIEYTLRDAAGEVLDATAPGDPLTFLLGVGRILPGLERALVSRAAGEELHVEITPDEAYGFRDPELIERVPRAQFQGGREVAIGERFEARSGNRLRFATVVGIEGDDVLLDLNHPLAEHTLHVDVRILDVRAASPAEAIAGRALPGLGGPA